MRVESMKKYKVSEETQRVIEKDDSASSITTDCEDGKPYSLPCIQKLAVLIESVKFQIIIIFLVIIDLIIVSLGLLFGNQVANINESFRSSLCPMLHIASLFFLALFVIELLFRMIALRFEFFKNWIEVFDGVVILLTFSLDIVSSRHYDSFQPVIGLFIILRLWRIWKIIYYVVGEARSDLNRQLRHEKRRKEAVERELTKYRRYCTVQDKEITYLQNLLKKHGISFSSVENPSAGERISVVVEVNNVVAMDKDTIAKDSITNREIIDYSTV